MLRYVVCATLLFSGQAWATSWYIDPVSGSSGNAGTEAAPKSAYSQLTVAAGDEIYFKRGTTHNAAISVTSGNSVGDPTLYGAYGSGAKPILTSNTNTFGGSDRDYVSAENLNIQTTTSSAASVRMDRPQDIVFDSCEFSGGLNGIRMEAISTGGSQTLDRVTIRNSTFTGQTQNGIFMIIGATDAEVVSSGVTITGNEFTGIGKEATRLTYQSQSFGVRDHRYISVTFTDNYAHDLLRTTPSSLDTPPHDQCFHFKNLREPTLGNSVIARNKIKNCGRLASETSGDASLITGFWFEGLTNTYVYDNVADNIMTPGTADGGAFFLDSSCFLGTGCSSPSTEYVSTGNYFMRNVAANTNNNKACSPFTGSNCNNSEGFSITRGARDNVFISNIAYNNAIGFHVVGNAGVNYFYNNTAGSNDYGFYIQSNSGDTPAGEAQVLRNNVTYGNTVKDYMHSTALTPKADEQYNLIGTIENDTVHGTTVTADPRFVGGTRPMSPWGFAPSAISPMIANGNDATCAAQDFYGDAFRAECDLGAIRRDQCYRRSESGSKSPARTRAEIVSRCRGIPGRYPEGL